MTSPSGLSATIACRGLANARSSVGSLANTGKMPMTAMSLIGNRLFSPSASMASPPTPRNSTPRRSLAQRPHQLEAELIAGMLARDERDAQRPRRAHDQSRRRTGRRLRPRAMTLARRRSARRRRRARCLRVRRARPPRSSAGPTAGRSSRRSWPRLAALTKTPAAPLRRRRRGAQLGDAREHRVGAFGRLDREHAPVGDDDALPDVERRQRCEQRRAAARCRPRPRRRAARAPMAPPAPSNCGAKSCAPTIRRPSRSKIPAMPRAGGCRRRETACASSPARA